MVEAVVLLRILLARRVGEQEDFSCGGLMRAMQHRDTCTRGANSALRGTSHDGLDVLSLALGR